MFRACRSIRRTELAARSTWKTRRIRSATIFDVHRSTGYPAATVPWRMISLSCCFCTSLSFGWRPEPFFRARTWSSPSDCLSFRRQFLTDEVETSAMSTMSSLSYPLRINCPPCSRVAAWDDKLPCVVLIIRNTHEQLEKFKYF